jgi:hypothetical protein
MIAKLVCGFCISLMIYFAKKTQDVAAMFAEWLPTLRLC